MAANSALAQATEVEIRIVKTRPGVRVQADADRMQQVLANLLSNAVKFYSGGAVEVGVVSRGERVCVSVTDSGPGIPEDFQERVFERLAEALTSSTRQQGGTGLGLSISKAIVERHHGRIMICAEPEAGTTFFFDLPVWVPTEELTVREPVDGAVRILVCEDDHDVARLLTLMLEREGYEVDVADDAEEAKRLLAQGHYQAMTLYLMPPGQDGISLLRELLAQGGGALPVPVVVVSAGWRRASRRSRATPSRSSTGWPSPSTRTGWRTPCAARSWAA